MESVTQGQFPYDRGQGLANPLLTGGSISGHVQSTFFSAICEHFERRCGRRCRDKVWRKMSGTVGLKGRRLLVESLPYAESNARSLKTLYQLRALNATHDLN